MTMPINERSLAEEALTVVDSSVAQAIEGFDIDAWIAGVRPTRRSVKLHPDAHLIARMEQIADRIDGAPAEANVDDLIAEFEECKRQFNDGVWFTLEKRSSDWEKTFREKVAAELGIADLEKATTEQTVEVILRQVVAQTITPVGLTVDHLRKMLELNEAELNKLIVTLDNVQKRLAEQAGVLTRDFSQRRSSGRRSS